MNDGCSLMEAPASQHVRVPLRRGRSGQIQERRPRTRVALQNHLE